MKQTLVTCLSFVFLGFSLQGQQIRSQEFIRSTDTAGTVIQDPNAPISFQLPPGWTLIGGERWGDHETTLQLAANGAPQEVTLYYQYPFHHHLLPDSEAALRKEMDNKVLLRHNAGFTDYHVRAGSIQREVVGGNPAMAFLGDYTSKDGQPEVEYMFRVLGNMSKAHFYFKMSAAAEARVFIDRLVPVVQTLRIP